MLKKHTGTSGKPQLCAAIPQKPSWPAVTSGTDCQDIVACIFS